MTTEEIRTEALDKAVTMITGTFTDPQRTDVIPLAREFYDFLRGDTEIASGSEESDLGF